MAEARARHCVFCTCAPAVILADLPVDHVFSPRCVFTVSIVYSYTIYYYYYYYYCTLLLLATHSDAPRVAAWASAPPGGSVDRLDSLIRRGGFTDLTVDSHGPYGVETRDAVELKVLREI